MGLVVVQCAGCGARLRIARPEPARNRHCPSPRCLTPIDADHAASGSPTTIRPRPAALALCLGGLALAIALVLGLVGLHRGTRPAGSIAPSLRIVMESPSPPRAERPDAGPRPSEAARVEPGVAESPTIRPIRPVPLVRSGPFRPSGARTVAAGRVSRDASPPPAPDDVPPLAPAPSRLRLTSAPTPASPSPAPEDAPPDAQVPKRIRVRTDSGRSVVARVHGQAEGRTCVILPDSRLGFASKGVALTDEPFRPATADEMLEALRPGPYAGFKVRKSAHYLIFYQSTKEFADASGDLLERLYKHLTESLRKRDFPVHEAEFPLVAVIFHTERDFRAHQKVDPNVQAYYEIFSNRIYFYQTSDHDRQAPEVAALRKPQTVAHEGTHQILQNIGIHPRLASWPIWLVEGLAEYCSPPTMTRKGATWGGLGLVNPMHMATFRDLQDPLSLQVQGTNIPRVGRDPNMPLVEYLVTRTDLTPTDYALSWAMTHYLAQKRVNEFLAYLKTMSRMPPLERRTPEDHLAAFRAAFGADLAKLDRAIGTHLAKLKGYDQLPYFAVMFQQPIGGGMVRRAAIVSQSPSLIRQWLETVSAPDGGTPNWEVLPHPTRARALLTAQQWLGSRH